MGKMLRPTILSISLITIMSGAAVGPALGNIAADFSNADITLIKLILTLPSMLIIPSIFVASRLCKILKKRNILLIGISVYLVGGVSGGLANNISLLLASRALLGIGVGLIMPLSTALVADFYDGDMRTKVMGQVSATTQVGGIVSTVLSGCLAAMCWRYCFGIYLLALIPGLLVIFFLPEPTYCEQETLNEVNTKTQKLPKEVYLSAAIIFLIWVGFYSIPVNMAMFLNSGSEVAGIVIALSNLAGFIAGLSLSWINNTLKTYLIMFNLGIIAVGFGLIGVSQSIVTITIGVILVGFGLCTIFPYVLTSVTRKIEPKQTVRSMAVVTSMIYLGQFMSPFILDTIGAIFNNETIRFTYQFLGSAFAISFIVLLVITLFSNKSTPNRTMNIRS